MTQSARTAPQILEAIAIDETASQSVTRVRGINSFRFILGVIGVVLTLFLSLLDTCGEQQQSLLQNQDYNLIHSESPHGPKVVSDTTSNTSTLQNVLGLQMPNLSSPAHRLMTNEENESSHGSQIFRAGPRRFDGETASSLSNYNTSRPVVQQQRQHMNKSKLDGTTTLRHGYVVALFTRKWRSELTYVGSGTLIRPNLVLSSAQCVLNNNTKIARIALKNLPLGSGTQDGGNVAEEFRIKRTIVHPDFDGVNNDIALVVLDGRSAHKTVELNMEAAVPKTGADLVAVVWDHQGPSTSSSLVPRQVALRSLDINSCKEGEDEGVEKLNGTILCGTNIGHVTSRGNSGGGPLILHGMDESGSDDRLVGLVSSSKRRCIGASRACWYVRVSSFVGWIEDTRKALSRGDDSNEGADTTHPSTGQKARTTGNNEGGTGNDISSRIVGGEEVKENRYAYLASIFVQKPGNILMHMCGGSLIRSNVVLSSAHCVRKEPDIIGMGIHDIRDFDSRKASMEEFRILESIEHPFFDGVDYDVVLFVLDGKSRYEPVTMNSRSKTPKTGTKLAVVGWGDQSYRGEPSPVPLEATVRSMSNNDCSDLYVGTLDVTRNMICANGGGKDACSGDSGGPLVVKGEDDHGGDDLLVGVVSTGIECGHDEFPGVYARVSSFIGWIEDQLEEIDKKYGDGSNEDEDEDFYGEDDGTQRNDTTEEEDEDDEEEATTDEDRDDGDDDDNNTGSEEESGENTDRDDKDDKDGKGGKGGKGDTDEEDDKDKGKKGGGGKDGDQGKDKEKGKKGGNTKKDKGVYRHRGGDTEKEGGKSGKLSEIGGTYRQEQDSDESRDTKEDSDTDSDRSRDKEKEEENSDKSRDRENDEGTDTDDEAQHTDRSRDKDTDSSSKHTEKSRYEDRDSDDGRDRKKTRRQVQEQRENHGKRLRQR